MANRETRRLLAASTIEVMESGQLGDSDITNFIQKSIDGTCSYSEGAILPPILPKPPSTSSCETQFYVMNTTTLEAAHDLLPRRDETVSGTNTAGTPAPTVAVLNFASARNPGGGFLKGARAQEESLAMNSTLYGCLKDDPMYKYHNKLKGNDGLYSDWTIFSPNVPVIRNEDDGRLLEEPWFFSVLTCPCINSTRFKADGGDHELEQLLRKRMLRLFNVLAAHHVGDLVLGAWGCGVFGNDATIIAKLFSELLKEDERFVNRWPRVVFAVYTKDQAILQAFQERFSSVSS